MNRGSWLPTDRPTDRGGLTKGVYFLPLCPKRQPTIERSGADGGCEAFPSLPPSIVEDQPTDSLCCTAFEALPWPTIIIRVQRLLWDSTWMSAF